MLKVNKEKKVPPVHKVNKETQVPRVRKVFKGKRVILVHKVNKVYKVKREKKVILVHKVNREKVLGKDYGPIAIPTLAEIKYNGTMNHGNLCALCQGHVSKESLGKIMIG